MRSIEENRETCRPEKLNVMTKMETTTTKLERANERMNLIYGAEQRFNFALPACRYTHTNLTKRMKIKRRKKENNQKS